MTNMNLEEKELQKLLNREKVERVSISDKEINIKTEDKEITIQISSSSSLKLDINDREFVE